MFVNVTAFASILTLPKPTGIFSVGTKAIEIRDPSRQMFRDTNPRRWMIQVFYPCKTHQETSHYMPDTLQDGIVDGVHVMAHAKLDAQILSGQKFPVIFFVPGIGSERQKYTILCEELASHGYIVFAIDEPYVSNFVKFPDGTTIVYRFIDAWKHFRRSDRDYRYKYFDEAMDSIMDDICYMIDHLGDLNQQFNGNLDIHTLIIMGHSFGGNVAHTFGFRDKRIKAIVDIDSKITDRAIHGHLGVPENNDAKPVLFIRGMMQYQEDVGDKLKNIANATYWEPHVQHGAFSDEAYFSVLIPTFRQPGFLKIICNYIFKRGPLLDATDTNLGGKNINSWLNEYHEKIVKWLDAQVMKTYS